MRKGTITIILVFSLDTNNIVTIFNAYYLSGLRLGSLNPYSTVN